jgi:hypothetical protein
VPRWTAIGTVFVENVDRIGSSHDFRYSGLEYCPISASLSLPEQVILRDEVKKTARILII